MNIVRVDPLKVTGEIPERMAPWIEAGQAVEPRGRVSGQAVHRHGVAHQSGRQHADARVRRSKRCVPNDDGVASSRAPSPASTSRRRSSNSVLTIPYAANAVSLRRESRLRGREGDHLAMHELKIGDRAAAIASRFSDGVNAGDVIALTDVDNLTDGMKVSVGSRNGVVMLSELCVRRPGVRHDARSCRSWCSASSPSATLGVDLFPKADPATVNVPLRLPGASPDEMTSSVVMPMENALSGIAGIDQLHGQRRPPAASASITVRFVLERDLDDAANSVREKVAGAMRNVPPGSSRRRSSRRPIPTPTRS